MRRVSLGVVGCGNRGSKLIRRFAEDERVEMTYSCDRNEERLARVKQRSPKMTATTEFGDLLDDRGLDDRGLDDRGLDDRGLDAIVIATGTDSHFTLAHEALLASKHVLIEAPMCHTVNQCKDLVQLAREVGKVLMVDHTLIYHPAIQRINEMIEKRETGYLCYLTFLHSAPSAGVLDEGVVWRLAYQDLAVLDFFLAEPPLSVQASSASHGTGVSDTIAYINLSFDGNTIAHIQANEESPVELHQIAIGCEKKTIHFDRFAATEQVKIFETNHKNGSGPDHSGGRYPAKAADMFAPALPKQDAMMSMCRHFIDCVINNQRPLTDGEAGLRVVSMLQMTDEALKAASSANITAR